MIRINRIDGIDQDSLELLEAAGFQHAGTLAKISATNLHRELSNANQLLRIVKTLPDAARLEQWIHAAREISGVTESDIESDASTAKADAFELLQSAPSAIPIPARLLVENQLGVSEVPSGIPLDQLEIACHLDAGLTAHDASASSKSNAANGFVRLAETNSPKLEIDTSRLRSIGEISGTDNTSADSSLSAETDRIALIRAPRKESNAGRDPNSRWYLRGILHKSPVLIYCGALATLMIALITPLAIVSAFLLLSSTYLPKSFSWVPSWLIVFPLALPIFGLLYAVFGNMGSCRVCCQKLFVPRQHLKNSRAHHVRLLGYILPLCVHIVLFRWFRCTHCGTPIRLKE